MKTLNNSLNIVTFDVPYPPNYGGAIDLFYKIKELYELGVKIHLHIFEYGRGEPVELNQFCESIIYYKRNKSLLSLFSFTPYIIKSRNSKILLKNLNHNELPVIFEGLHTIGLISKVKAKTYIRTHNIEHFFYCGLAKSEKNIFKKLFFYSESLKLKFYEKKIKETHGVFTISKSEQTYFFKNFGKKVIYIPAFHDSSFKAINLQKGNYILWHGNLKVSDNRKSLVFLINIIKNTLFKLKIASSFKDNRILKKIDKHSNITFEFIKKQNDLDILIQNAQINILLTFQETGIKLKLLYVLYKGKFIIANNKMINNTGLESLCEKADTKTEILAKINLLFTKKFTKGFVEKRKEILQKFDPNKSAQKIVNVIFKK